MKQKINLNYFADKECNRFLKIMKISFFTIFLCIFTIAAENIYPQQTEISLNIKNVTLKKAISEIEKASDYVFLISDEAKSELSNTASIDANKENIQTILEKLLDDSNLGYKITERQVSIYKSEKPKPTIVEVLKVAESTQQKKKITGRVIDEEGGPIIGANIIELTTTNGTISDMSGQFTLYVNEKSTIKISFVGYLDHNFYIGDASEIIVVLKEDAQSLDELVITGYQTLLKSDMVGSVSKINMEDILTPNHMTVDKMLQGIVPGMVVTNSSSRVGTTPSIKIRGTSTLLGDTEPLWVVDGIIQEDPISIPAASLMTDDMKNIIGNQISWLSPNDIETITVLKDASATAIYGSKASNGVIVVTTKMASRSQESLSVNYSGSVTIDSRPNYGMFNLMNSQERVAFSDEAFASGVPYSYIPYKDYYSYEGVKRLLIEGDITNSEYQSKRAFLETVNTDWFNLLTRNGVSTNHNLSISGGSSKMGFSSSLGYTNQQGQEIGNNAERFTARVATLFRLTSKVRVNLSLLGSYNINTGFGSGVNPMSFATNTSRAIPAFTEDGDMVYFQKVNGYQHNKLLPTLGYNILNEINNSGSSTAAMRLAATADVLWSIGSGFSYNFTGGYNLGGIFMDSYMSEDTYYTANLYRGYDFGTQGPETPSFKAAILPFGGEYFTNDARQISYNIQNKLSYVKNFENSRLNLFLGQEVRSGTNISTSNTVWGFSKERGEQIIAPTSPADLILAGGATITYTGNGVFDRLYSGRWKRLNQTNNFMSFFSTAAYTLKDRYVLNASIRNDMSNRFGQNINKRFDPVYSFGAAWRISEEEIIKNNASWISQFNIRSSFGLQGNALANESPELILQKQNKKPLFNQYFATISKIPNPNLSWERTTNWNVGTDLMLFNKVSLVVDYYGRKSNAVISQAVPLEFGVTNAKVNGGMLYNNGIEGTLSFSVFNNKTRALSVSINSSRNWNKTGKSLVVPTFANFITGTAGVILKEGYPINSIWSFDFAELNADTGVPTFNLMDVDRETAKKDPSSYLVFSGETQPNFTGGISFSFRYKAFKASTSFFALLGGIRRLVNPYQNFNNGTKLPAVDLNISKSLNNRWREPGDEQTTNIPSLSIFNVNYVVLPDQVTNKYPIEMWSQSTAQIVDASFLRNRGIDLEYRLNQRLAKVIGLRNASITASVNNLFVIASKRFEGMDPELGNSVMPKSFSIGLQIGL